MEASGTSGMKAALNGIPNLSVLDGWWLEGHIEGLTGWSIGEPVHGKREARNHSQDVPSLYDKLEHAVIPSFYHDRERYMDMMTCSIAINGSFFNTRGWCRSRCSMPIEIAEKAFPVEVISIEG